MLVKDIMTPNWAPVTEESTLRDVIEVFRKTRLDASPVVNENNEVVGVFTKYKLYQALLDGYKLSHKINDFVIRNPVKITGDENFPSLQKLLIKHQVAQAIVTDENNKAMGVVTKVDLIRTLESQANTFANELAALVNAIKNGVVAINAKGIITLLNPAAESLLGCRAGDLVGKPIGKTLTKLNLMKVARTGQIEPWHKIKVGDAVVMAQVSPVFEKGRVTGTIAVLHDLTEYEQVAQELETVKKLQHTLELVLELAYDGVFLVDEEGKVTMANKSLVEFLGKASQEQVVGKLVQEVFPEAKMEEILASGVTDIGEVQLLKGHKCVITRLPIVKDGQVIGAVGKVIYRELDKLRDVLHRLDTLEKQLTFYKNELNRITESNLKIADIVCSSRKMEQVKREAAQAAKGYSTVLILGESGTGKELFARAIHNESGRTGPMVKVNCAAIPENLLESEFFGYADGAFTGAKKGGKPGKFELADGGTLFLDEIGDMSPYLQAKLLRVLQDKEFERVGGTETVKVNVRIIAATNQDLNRLVAEGKFREDLYYRLNVICLQLPPLRERPEDILPIAMSLINKFNYVMGTKVTGLTPDALALLRQHSWPGNVRELENVIERAMNLIYQGLIDVKHLPAYLSEKSVTITASPGKVDSISYHQNLEKTERELIVSALEKARGNRSKAAKLMGISRSSLYEKLSKYAIGPKQ